MKSSPPRLYEYGSVRSTGGDEAGRIVRDAGTIRSRPSGSISTPATRPPEAGKRSRRDTGVRVTVSGFSNACGGSSHDKKSAGGGALVGGSSGPLRPPADTRRSQA